MNTVQSLDLGKTSAKYASTDELLAVMRKVVRDNKDAGHGEAVKLWLAEVREHEDYETVLLPAIERYAGNALWRRCVMQAPDDRNEARKRETKDRTKGIISSEIILWTWKLPTTGKQLCDCTFQEVSEAAPLAGRFLSKLSAQGAPGSLIKEVFDQKELQEFWATSQISEALPLMPRPVRMLNEEDAKKEIKDFFETNHGEILYPSDVSDALNLDYEFLERIVWVLENEGKIATVFKHAAPPPSVTRDPGR